MTSCRNSRNILTSKWKSLQLKPITGEAIVNMRLNAYKMMCQRKSNYDTKPNWYIMNTVLTDLKVVYRYLCLKDETMSICNEAEDLERDNILIELKYFSNFDDRSIQFVEVNATAYFNLNDFIYFHVNSKNCSC